jgi:Taurine catabolism dioxygenase TauD, TfdA family
MSPRKAITGNVLESTRIGENLKIGLHSEMAYMKSFPPRIAFFCKTAASIGGETIIGDMREFMKLMPQDLREKLEAADIQVVRNYAQPTARSASASFDHPDQVGWDAAFFTDDPREVENSCRQLGIRPLWNEDGTLTLIETMRPFTDHPVTGERIYRCNLHLKEPLSGPGFAKLNQEIRAKQAHRSGYYLSNGEELSDAEAKTIKDLYSRVELSWRWQDNDVLILDNLQVSHGRNPFSGPREVMVALLA